MTKGWGTRCDAAMEAVGLIERLQFAREHALDILDIDEIARARHRIVTYGRGAMVPLLASIEQQKLPDKWVREILMEIAAVLDVEERRHALAAMRHHAVQGQHVVSRVIALEVLAQHADGATHDAHALLPVVQDSACPSKVRTQALRTMARAELDSISLRCVLDLVSDPSEEVALAALETIERNAAKVVPTAAVDQLLRLLLSVHGPVRRRAIELLGAFGEIDLVERLCALPVLEKADIDAVKSMVDRILRRPRSLLHISPQSFEHLVSRMLSALGYLDVRVTRFSHDGGVDLTAVREDVSDGLSKERRQYIIQCKRHRDNIGPQQIEEFITTLRQRPSAYGLFITTSLYTSEARAAVGVYRVKLLDRNDLLMHLANLFGEGQYCVPGFSVSP